MAEEPRRRDNRASIGGPGRSGKYQLRVSSNPSEPEWDRFLAATPGGNHLQSSMWGEVKSILGWQVVRVLATHGARIRGGAQVLLRALPVVGSIGYVSRGPVLESDDAALREAVLRGLRAVARERRILFLVVQPPLGQEAVIPDLAARGYRRTGGLVEPHPTATVMMDLAKDEDGLLAGMRKATRYNVRLAPRRGVRIRVGDEGDVALFYRLLTMTSRRQGFAVPSEDYFRELLRIMGPDGHARIFLAEADGRALSAALVIAFGDVVSYKRGAWSGEHRHLHPNEYLQWTVMCWAKQHGYRFYDLEGVDLASRQASRDAGRPAWSALDSVSAFKLGFGGDVVLSPGAYEWIHNPVLRRGYRWLVPPLLRSPPGRWIVDTVRTR
ncbi:MAG TPA: peptidoglycan bridge formation glycyltransferase FemA/FemB family protein [Pilimelia sp.]|nr:peptidoglycan bridge formation glycyltransferase FemA/FemB family protein [Pilimelia sp.]